MSNSTDNQRRNSNFEIILATKTSSHIINFSLPNFSQQKKACENIALLSSQIYIFANLVFLLKSIFSVLFSPLLPNQTLDLSTITSRLSHCTILPTISKIFLPRIHQPAVATTTPLCIRGLLVIGETWWFYVSPILGSPTVKGHEMFFTQNKLYKKVPIVKKF